METGHAGASRGAGRRHFRVHCRQAELTERLRRSEETASTSKAQCESAILEAAAQKERLAGLIDALASSFPCFIPEDVQHQMMEGDFSRAKMIFEQASRVDFSQYPIEEHKPKTISPGYQTQEPPLYGSGAFWVHGSTYGKKSPPKRVAGTFFSRACPGAIPFRAASIGDDIRSCRFRGFPA